MVRTFYLFVYTGSYVKNLIPKNLSMLGGIFIRNFQHPDSKVNCCPSSIWISLLSFSWQLMQAVVPHDHKFLVWFHILVEFWGTFEDKKFQHTWNLDCLRPCGHLMKVENFWVELWDMKYPTNMNSLNSCKQTEPNDCRIVHGSGRTGPKHTKPNPTLERAESGLGFAEAF